MGKYAKKKKKNRHSGRGWMLAALAALLALVVWLVLLAKETEIPVLEQPGETFPTEPPATQTQPQPTQTDTILLSDGLQILDIGSYAGIYMEDGSDETVADVMMILLENTSGQDLQLARIEIAYPDFTAAFEVTNLPAGEKVVLLEKNRHGAVAEDYLSVNTRNVVFFSEPMSLQADKLEISGSNGVLDLTNISGQDIAGPVYVYYKNSAADLLYGGITYRVELKNGLAAGETIRTITGHYSPDTSRILMAAIGD